MRAAALVLGLALSAACASPAEEAPPPAATGSVPAPVAGITAEAVQLRTDAAIGGRVHLRITAARDATFTVTGVALDSPGFAPAPPATVTAEFTAGRIIDLPVSHGETICSADVRPAVARLTVVRPGGTSQELVVPLGAEALARIHRTECAVRALAETVDVGVTLLQDDGDVLTGELLLTRRGGREPVRVTSVSRSVLVDVAVDGLPLEMAGDRAATAVSFTPAGCDPHVLSEAKQPYRFVVLVSVGEEEPVAMDLPLDADARSQLAGLVQRVCAERN